jgi:hypothetical protein
VMETESRQVQPRFFTFRGKEYEWCPLVWTAAPRGPKLIRYLAWGECIPLFLFTAFALIGGTMGNLALRSEGVYGEATFSVVLGVGLLVSIVCVPLLAFASRTWDASPEEGDEQPEGGEGEPAV